jgi:hypothetical protein
MVAKTKAAKKGGSSRRSRLLNLAYKVDLIGDRVVIDGKNGGNIRARGMQPVSFSCGLNVPRFKIICTDFEFNDKGDGDDAWAFEGTPPTGWLTAFSRRLRRPEKGALQLIFKYTIEADVVDTVPADPIIIIER